VALLYSAITPGFIGHITTTPIATDGTCSLPHSFHDAGTSHGWDRAGGEGGTRKSLAHFQPHLRCVGAALCRRAPSQTADLDCQGAVALSPPLPGLTRPCQERD